MQQLFMHAKMHEKNQLCHYIDCTLHVQLGALIILLYTIYEPLHKI